MSRLRWPDGPQVAVAMTPIDMQTLNALASKYGVTRLIHELTGLDDTNRINNLDSPAFSATSAAPSVSTTTSAPWSCESSAFTPDTASLDGSILPQPSYGGDSLTHLVLPPSGDPAYQSPAVADWPDTPMTTLDSPMSPLPAPAFPDLDLKPFTISQIKPTIHSAPPRSVPQSPAHPPPFSPTRPRKRAPSNPHRPHTANTNTSISTAASTSAAGAAAAAAAMPVPGPGPKKPISCPICDLHDLPVGFGRKSDFKKHLSNFHVSDALWVCPAPGCRVVFDFEKAYVAHARTDHGVSVQQQQPQQPGTAAAGLQIHDDDDDAAAARNHHHQHSHLPPGGGRGPCSPDAVRVQACPQVVFACGFLGCKEVVEARDDAGAPAAAERWMEHLCGHFDRRAFGGKGGRGALGSLGKDRPLSPSDGGSGGANVPSASASASASGKKRPAVLVDGPAVAASWTYYTQVQNLLRQSCLKDAWKAASWNKSVRTSLRWQPRSSGDLKKVLETRHFGADVPRLLHAAFTLGSSRFADPEMGPPGGAGRGASSSGADGVDRGDEGVGFLGEAARPVLGKCPFAEGGHRGGRARGGRDASASLVPMRSALAFKSDSASNSGGIFGGFGASSLSRCVPEEPDSLEYAHPGTPFVVPETESWAVDDGSLFGPPEEASGIHGAHMFDSTGVYGGLALHQSQGTVGVPGLGLSADTQPQQSHPLSAWTGVESLGAFPSEQDVIGGGEVDEGNVQQQRRGNEVLRSPKRGFGWMRGGETPRLLKKRGGPLCDEAGRSFG